MSEEKLSDAEASRVQAAIDIEQQTPRDLVFQPVPPMPYEIIKVHEVMEATQDGSSRHRRNIYYADQEICKHAAKTHHGNWGDTMVHPALKIDNKIYLLAQQEPVELQDPAEIMEAIKHELLNELPTIDQLDKLDHDQLAEVASCCIVLMRRPADK